MDADKQSLSVENDSANSESKTDRNEVFDYRVKTRGFYNSQQFKKLETEAANVRENKAQFRGGSWKIYEFYAALQCRYDEPENMWNLHEQIHKAWVKAEPDSITARVAQADFYTNNAWRARGNGWASEVTAEGWRLFKERLEIADKILDEAYELKIKCPMWWLVKMRVALGLDSTRSQYDKLFEDAKTFEPKFWEYDLARANYLLPRWHGKPGEWEIFAENEANRSNGLGLEIYARIVCSLMGYYNNIFDETKASWSMTRDGLELMRKSYPQSERIPNLLCKFACLAGDRVTAQRLFAEIGDAKVSGVWINQNQFNHFRKWAASSTNSHPNQFDGK